MYLYMYMYMYMQGGEPDINSVAKMILNDFQRGKLPHFVKPTLNLVSNRMSIYTCNICTFAYMYMSCMNHFQLTSSHMASWLVNYYN